MKRLFKIVRKIVVGAVLAFAAFVGGDIGIRALTQEKTPLTPEQIAEARVVFGDEIDYSKVRIADSRFSYFQSPETIVTIGNTIHWPPKDDVPADTATTTAKTPQGMVKKPVQKPLITVGYAPAKTGKETDPFIHEMTHIWQNQHDIRHTGVTGAIGLWFRNIFNGAATDVYAYTLDSTKRLDDYNIEQQAKIVEDYSIMTRHIEKYPSLPVPPEYALLKKTVEAFIPHPPPAASHIKGPGV